MGTINHQANPLTAQIKDKEARRGAVTCFKATELSGRQIKAFLPGGSSTIKNQINKKTWAKHRQAPITVRKKRWGGGGASPYAPSFFCPSIASSTRPPLGLWRKLPLWLPLCVRGIQGTTRKPVVFGFAVCLGISHFTSLGLHFSVSKMMSVKRQF